MVTIAVLSVAFVALIVIFLCIMGVGNSSKYTDDSFRWGGRDDS